MVLANGDGTFQARQAFAHPLFPAFGSLLVADADGGGRLDVLVGRSQGFSLFLGNGDGTLQARTNIATGGLGNAVLAVADVDGDGRPDVITANENSADVSVLLGNGDGSFQAPRRFSLEAQMSPTFVAAGDIDADGRLDLLASTRLGAGAGARAVAILRGRGDGTFSSPERYRGSQPHFIAPRDLNGDSLLDLIVVNGDDRVSIFFHR